MIRQFGPCIAIVLVSTLAACLPDDTDGSPGGDFVADAISAPLALTVDGDQIYWVTRAGELLKVDKGGGTPVALMSGIIGPGQVLAVNDEFAFVVSREDGLLKVSTSGDGAVEVVSEGTPKDVVSRGDHVYFSTGNAIARAPQASGAASDVVAELDYADVLAVDDTHVYWVNRLLGVLSRAALDGADIVELDTITGDAHPTVVLDDNNVYWGVNGYVARVQKRDLSTATLSSEYYSALRLWTDGFHLYTQRLVADGRAEIARLSVDGGEFTTLVGDIEATNQAPPLALDDQYIYWANVPPEDNAMATIRRFRK